ncbi:holin family protein [Yoonia sediminilitoris]|uniref:Holin (3TMs family) n=1 Tax=Yoonia sediminilitoris TaxID=1286148 RepID=A0A2T6KRU7_9RHOB|nr:holin family protein [Yoonia sediminilitoris]PUB19283.1 holin (3TMs family) [Yoonia sediminilitoris]RCW99451.1 holin (3TMs family) [Yoonia sediminilitoris]
MGLISGLMNFLFGDGRNLVVETAEVFKENTEKGAVREAQARSDSLQQFAAEFMHPRRGVFDRLVDALNRLPRPLLALGTIWLFVTAIQSPETFSEGMKGIALVPEPLWWMMGAIVSFYFGARHQAKGQDFQRSVASSLMLAQTLKGPEAPEQPDGAPQAPSAPNAALLDWQGKNGK